MTDWLVRLPLLICPASMVLMLWLMRRERCGTVGDEATRAMLPHRHTKRTHLRRGWCVATLVLFLTGAWIMVPPAFRFLLPALVALMCPLSMGLMLHRMRHDRQLADLRSGAARTGQSVRDGVSAAERDAIAREIARLEAMTSMTGESIAARLAVDRSCEVSQVPPLLRDVPAGADHVG
jgi:hypothetical protein